jgi:hypothetical protein
MVSSGAEWQLLSGAMVHPDYGGPVPNKSDVVFSTRSKRTDSLYAIKAFKATRVEWVYSTDKAFVESIKELTGWFGGAINANVKPLSDAGVARDFDGNLLVAPWMKGWGGKWITTTHPVSVKALKERAESIVNAGADSIQVDDPLLQLHSADWGGDFNGSTLEGFKEYLSTYPDKTELAALGIAQFTGSDYREFLKAKYAIKDAKDYLKRYRSIPTTSLWTKYLRASVYQHFVEFRGYLNGVRGKTFPLSMNLAYLDKPDEKNRHFFLAGLADYAIVETAIANTSHLVVQAATMRALGVGYVPSIQPRSLADNRVAIATLYALGGQPLVPWDIYMGSDESGQSQRFYGSVADYEPLYAFVRRYPMLFDGMEATAVVGIPIPVDKFRKEETMQLIQRLNQMSVPFAFVLMGGNDRKFKVDASRAKYFKTLVTVNPETDFSTDDLRDLRGLNVSKVDSSDLTDEAIRNLAPLTVVGGMGAVKLYPRVNPSSNRGNLVVHVIDESRGAEAEAYAGCKRRISIKKNVMVAKNITEAAWHSLNAVTPLTISGSAQETIVTIPECRMWGLLSFKFQ